jgi:hypothetical protein
MKRLLLVALTSACASEVADVEAPGDYTAWSAKIITYGDTPGHGDTYRVIYINDIGASGAPAPQNTVVVKEVYNRDDRNGEPAPGSLRVIELMRRTGDPNGSPPDRGWLFTAASEPNGEETVGEFCWRRCHQAAPKDGAWFDYSKL